MEQKTSAEWYDQIYPEAELIIMDPDGWDRKNWQYSWYEEPITKQEFRIRVMKSTCIGKLDRIQELKEQVKSGS